MVTFLRFDSCIKLKTWEANDTQKALAVLLYKHTKGKQNMHEKIPDIFWPSFQTVRMVHAAEE